MSLILPSSMAWRDQCAADGEFSNAARYWTGGLTLNIGDQRLELSLNDGELVTSRAEPEKIISYSADVALWSEIVKAIPKRFNNDLMATLSQGQGMSREGDPLLHAQYFAAVMRAVELLRPVVVPAPTMNHDAKPKGSIDAPVGRYIHLELGGHSHRIYFEEAGTGIPLLMQHTAGAHSSQWRHIFEMPEITDRFRLIAYDLPFHGKSMPPVDTNWWETRYNLKGEFLRSVPVALSEALGLVDPVFMGCSVGGLLALDLAHRHSDKFRAVISIEGALSINGKLTDFKELWHPQVNNEYKARLMDGLMSPTSPKAYRKETSFVYSSGWPPAFIGDLFYYVEDYNLTETAGEIDTDEVGVYILSGEYDYSGTAELGRAAHEAIAGSSWQEMKGVGHFPMAENPATFLTYLRPILEQIAG